MVLTRTKPGCLRKCVTRKSLPGRDHSFNGREATIDITYPGLPVGQIWSKYVEIAYDMVPLDAF